MKKTFISLLALFLALPLVWAVPADPTPYKYTQPDGSVIILQNHGDEYFHWTTDAVGRIVEKGPDGFYRPTGESLQSLAARAEQQRQINYLEMNKAIWSSYDNPPVTNFGDRKVLCIIANFTDSTFIVENPQQHFYNMLNQAGYSENGAIGSVRDYFIDNSGGLYRPQFDVYGPVTLSQSSAYYDQKSVGVSTAIQEAYNLMKEQISIDQYDTDNDGAVDMVLFYYPGHNEAEGGGTESIWPHQGTGYYGTLGTKSFVRYFCTSELRGASGTEPAAIGTTCHEFSHSLGLPDFYDTDYNQSGGQNTTTGPFDLMTGGNYNDNGRRPPYLNALERNMLGWMNSPDLITSAGSYSLLPVQNNVAYQFESSVSGEYFILETRNGNKWDSALPASGLLLYHIDKSDRLVGGGYTAADLWNTNDINAYGGHPCFYLVPSVDNPSYWSQYVFPGYSNVTSFIPYDWDGNPASIALSAISYDGAKTSFSVAMSTGRTVYGTVKDTEGHPIQGVEVSLTPSTAAFAAPSLVSTSISCVTGSDGSFSLVLDEEASNYQILAAYKNGYVPAYVNLTLSSVFTLYDFVMLAQGEDTPVDLYKYDNTLGLYSWTFGEGSRAVGIKYTADELEASGSVGGQLKSVTFMSAATVYDAVYIVVDIEGETTLRKDITSQYTPNTLVTIDIFDENIIIPEGKAMYIGYGVSNPSTEEYPFYAYCYSDTDHDGFYTCYDFMNSNSWGNVNAGKNQYADLLVSATVARTQDVTFSTMGVSYIAIDGGTPKVVVAAGKSLRSTAWYLDGEAVVTPPAIGSLSSGTHTYMVRLNYYDGTSERIYYEVTAL